jgi:hypothetical protein
VAVPTPDGRIRLEATTDSEPSPVAWGLPDLAARTSPSGARAHPDAHGALTLTADRGPGVETCHVEVLDGPVLRLTLAAHADEVVGLTALHGPPVTTDRVGVAAGCHQVDVPLLETGPDGISRPLPSVDAWRLDRFGDGEHGPVGLTADVAARLPLRRRGAGGVVELTRSSRGLGIRIHPELAPDEVAKRRSARLTRASYSAARATPLTAEALVVSADASGAGSSAALVAGLAARGVPVHWAVQDGSWVVPEGAAPVLLRSSAFAALLGRTRLVVLDGPSPSVFEPREGQHVLQTGYSRPLGRVGHEAHGHTAGELAALDRDASHWSVLLAAGPWAVAQQRRALRYAGPVAETGTPGLDAVVTGDRATARRRVEAALGLDPGTRIVHWIAAPQGIAGLDAVALARQLGAVVITRQRRRVAVAREDGVLATSRVSPLDALAAADDHVTNHASGALDAVLTGAPVHLFGAGCLGGLDDVDRAAVPAPHRDTTALRAALESHDTTDWSAFRARFTTLEDGHATERALAALDRLGALGAS